MESAHDADDDGSGHVDLGTLVRTRSVLLRSISTKLDTESGGKLHPSKTAVLFIEFQNAFMDERGKMFQGQGANAATWGSFKRQSKWLLDRCREDQPAVQVIHAPITFCAAYKASAEDKGIPYQPGVLGNDDVQKGFEAESSGRELYKDMAPIKTSRGDYKWGERVVVGKRGLDSFPGTNLDDMLQKQGIENLAICGFLTNCCVESTMRTAYELGYNVYTITDCCCAGCPEEHKRSVTETFPMFSTPRTAGEFMKLLSTGSDQTAFQRPSAVLHVREHRMFRELQDDVLEVMLLRGLNVAFTAEFVVALIDPPASVLAETGDTFARVLGVILVADMVFVTLAMLLIWKYCRSRSESNPHKKVDDAAMSHMRAGRPSAPVEWRSTFQRLLVVSGCVEILKTVLCTTFVLRPISSGESSSGSSGSSADVTIGFTFNAAMTIACAVLETALDFWYAELISCG